MKDKKYKYYEDIIEEYLQLLDEQIEIPKHIEKSKEKLDTIISGKAGSALKSGEANDAYKLFLQIKKHEDRKFELGEELLEAERLLKEYLGFMDGCKLPYKERDEEDNSKINYVFWLEEGQIKNSRQV